jgi:hypothetical protein
MLHLCEMAGSAPARGNESARKLQDIKPVDLAYMTKYK